MTERFVDASFDEEVRELCALLRIESVSRGTPEEGMPLGRGVNGALEYTLALARRLGFENARSLDGYCGVVDYGEGEEMLMVMSHLDVVPVGAGWDGDPFGAEIRDGKIFARGAEDDKGPAIASLYALKAIRDAGVPLKRRIRLFFGCDEESGWKCIERYKQTEPDPDLAFTPDASYPLVYSEMAITHAVYTRPMQGSAVRIECGSAANVIPGEAEAILGGELVEAALPEGFSAAYGEGVIRVTGFGGHAAHPQSARNALQGLLTALAAQPLEGDDLAAATGLTALLDFDMHGEGFGLDITDESGRLTLQPDMLTWNENEITLVLDCRHPFSVTGEMLDEAMDRNFNAIGFTRKWSTHKEGHYIAPDSELVSTLLSVYRKHTGSESAPLAIGGGTYARAFTNAVGFGVEREGAAACCHMPNEHMSLADLRFNTLIIAESMQKLAGK